MVDVNAAKVQIGRGRRPLGAYPATVNYFDGAIEECAFWNIPIQQNDVITLLSEYQSAYLTSQTCGLGAHYGGQDNGGAGATNINGKWTEIGTGVVHQFGHFVSFQGSKWYRKFVEALRFNTLTIAEITFALIGITPLAGTFPRPARVATMSLKVSQFGFPISGATVAVTINKPDGTLYRALSLIESKFTPGLYSANFRIFGSDEIGSYPFTATATVGNKTGTSNGFITIFQGPWTSIHFG